MVLDGLSMLLITMPVLHPVAISLGFDGVWFGILAVKMIELGLITPPIGINVYVVASTADEVAVEDAFRGLAPFYIVDVLTIGALFMFPGLVMWLPSLMRG
jgi:TRAP-type C4-dicarboxylate transport system permease large subunit